MAAAPGCGWSVTREREDVCPVVTLAPGIDFEGYLATLGKKERHEIRRKLRRAEAAGDVELTTSTTPLAAPRRLHRAAPEEVGRRTACFPRPSGGAQQPALLPAPVPPFRARRAAAADAPDRRRPARRERHPFRRRRDDQLLQRRRGPRGARPLAGRADGGAVRGAGHRRSAAAASIFCAATSPTSTNGAPWTNRFSASLSDAPEAEMTVPTAADPCVVAPIRPLLPGSGGSASSRCSRPAPTAARRSI